MFTDKIENSTKPLGYRAAEADWNKAFAGYEMDYDDWSSLTLGEQAMYAASECQMSGVVYSSNISTSTNCMTLTVSLPLSLKLHESLTKQDLESLEGFLRRKMEEQIVAILRIQEIKRENNVS